MRLEIKRWTEKGEAVTICGCTEMPSIRVLVRERSSREWVADHQRWNSAARRWELLDHNLHESKEHAILCAGAFLQNLYAAAR